MKKISRILLSMTVLLGLFFLPILGMAKDDSTVKDEETATEGETGKEEDNSKKEENPEDKDSQEEENPEKDDPQEDKPKEEKPKEEKPKEEKKPKKKVKKKNPQKMVYLTFDDGPNQYTPKILDTLKKKKVKATFFMIEGNIKRNPKTVNRMVKEGHHPALHSVTHDKYKLYMGSPLNVMKEMEKARKTLKSVSKFDSKLTRVPYGSKPYMNKSFRDPLAQKGYKMWDWNIDTLDWQYERTNPNQILANVKAGLKGKKGPFIILFHDRKGTAEKLPEIIDYLIKNGYTIEAYNPKEHVIMNFWKDKRL